MDTSSYDLTTSWISVTLAASKLRVSRQRVYQLLGTGALVGRRSAQTWLVAQRSVEARIALLRSESGV